MAAMLTAATFAQAPSRVEAQSTPFKLRMPSGASLLTSATAKKNMKVAAPFANAASAANKVAKADDLPTEVITEQPTGTLMKNLNRYAFGYMQFYGYTFYTEMDGYTSDVVKSDDGKTIYIKDPFSTIITDSWIKGTKGEGDTIEVKLPQLVFEEVDEGKTYRYYAYKMVLGEMEEDGETYQTFVKDSTSQTVKFVMRNDSIIKVGDELLGLANEAGIWGGYGDDVSVISKVTAPIYKPSEGSVAKQCLMTYKELGDEGLSDGAPILVNLVTEGNDIFIGGLDSNDPNLWVKGTLNGNKAVFTKDSYLGVDTVNSVHIYFMPASSTLSYNAIYEDYEWNTEFVDKIEFDYDAAAGTLKSTGHFALNQGVNTLFTRGYYAEPNIMPWTETAGTPKQVTFSTYNAYDSEYGYGNIAFYIDSYAADGSFMNPDKVYYNLYFDDELFTFYPDEYIYVKEDMTNVPLKFADSYDIYVDGTLHNVYFYSTGFNKIGVEVTYTGGGETHSSGIAWYDTSNINNAMISGNNAVKGVSYVDLSGRKVSNPTNGVFIKSVKYADGTVKNVKVVKR